MADAERQQQQPTAPRLSDDEFANLLVQTKVDEIEQAAQGQLSDDEFDLLLTDMAKTGTSNEEIDALKMAHLTKKHGQARVAKYVDKDGNPLGFQVLNDQGLPVATFGGIQGGFAVKVRRKAQSELLRGADTTTGAPAEVRLLANLKMTPQGKYNYLETEYGKGSVTPIFDSDGEIENFLIKTPDSDKPVLFDPSAAVLSDYPADIADITGDVIEGVPGAVGSVIGAGTGALAGGVGGTAAAPGVGTATGIVGGGVKGALVGGAIGDVVGSALRQGVAAMVPGEEELTAGERIGAGALNVATGVVGEGVGRGVGAAWKRISPRSRLARMLGREVTEEGAGAGRPALETARKALELEAATGVDLSLAEATGGRAAGELEKTLAQFPGSSASMAAARIKRAAQLETFAKKTAGVMSGGKVSASEAGKRVAAAVDAHVSHLAKMRADEARVLFDAAHKASGGKRILPVEHTMKALDDLLGERGEGILTGQDKAMVKALRAWKQDLVAASGAGEGAASALVDASGAPLRAAEAANATTSRAFQNSLSSIGKAAKGVGTIFENIDKSTSIAVASKIERALRRDLDAALSSGGLAGDVAESLAGARQAYAIASKKIDDARLEPFKKLLKMESLGSVDAFTDKLFGKTFSDDQVRTAMAFLWKSDPEAADTMSRAFLQEMLERSGPKAQSAIAKAGVTLGPAEIATLGSKEMKRAEAMLMGNPERLTGWRNLIATAKRMAGSAAEGGSDTATKLWWGKAMAAIASPRIAVGSGQGIMAQLATMTTAKRLAIIMNDRNARNIFLQLVDPPSKYPPALIRQSIIRLIGIVERNEALYNRGADSDEGDILQ